MILFGAVSGVSTAAVAAPGNCAPRDELLKALATKYHEAPAAVGLSSSGAVIEVLTSDQGATWTLLMSQPNGTSCLVAAGEEWQALKPDGTEASAPAHATGARADSAILAARH